MPRDETTHCGIGHPTAGENQDKNHTICPCHPDGDSSFRMTPTSIKLRIRDMQDTMQIDNRIF